jgi:hypothetical protein
MLHIQKAKEIRSAERTIKDLGKDAPKVKLFENFKDLGKLKKAGIVVGLATVAAGLIGKLLNSDKKEAPVPEQAAEVPAAQGQLAEVPQPQVPAQTPQAPAFAGAPVNQATLPIMQPQQFAAMQAAYYNSNSVASSLRSELIFSGDFTFSFWAIPYAGSTSAGNTQCWIGLYENAAVTPTSKWAFRFNNSGYVVTEDDTAKTTNVAPTLPQKYSIKRVGSTITYLVNDVLVYTSTITSSNPLCGIIRMPDSDPGRTFYDMTLTYNETRPVLKIGSPVNQTGVYDPNYAMIEAWLTTPQTISVTLNGVAATVITDPTVAPAAGQVLLLQKAGMLVFNPADAGKTVACTAMVMQET